MYIIVKITCYWIIYCMQIEMFWGSEVVSSLLLPLIFVYLEIASLV